jgi:hypothetical protein
MSLPKAFYYNTQTWFIRNQGPGGCYLYAALTCMDILYQNAAGNQSTPNLSYTFPHFFYNSEHLYNPVTKKFDLPNPYRFNQLEVLQHLGTCAETTMPTNFDRGLLEPTPDQMAEALHFRIQAWGPKESPVGNRPDGNFILKLKEHIYNIGPLIAFVWMGPHGPNDEGHVVALTGYDDDKLAFDFINSQGDLWGNQGHGMIPYANFAGSNLFPQITAVQWIKVAPLPANLSVPCGGINISTTSPNIGAGRNALTIRLGAVGQTKELILWDRNNSYVGAGHGLVDHASRTFNMLQVYDDSRNLILKFPLPSYPPLYHHVDYDWYLIIENHSIEHCNDYFATVEAELNGFIVTDARGREISSKATMPVKIRPSMTVRVDLKVLPETKKPVKEIA